MLQPSSIQIRLRHLAVTACAVYATLFGPWAIAQEGAGIGAVRGNVYDPDFNTPVAAAVVTLVETGQRATTDEEGYFIIKDVPIGTHTLVISKQGYSRLVRSGLVVLPGQLTEAASALQGEYTELDELVVRDVEFGSGSELGLLALRQQSSSLMDAVGSGLIGKAGHSTVAGALRLVSGASVEGGKYAVIRGLGDRYTSTQINSVRLPSADPEKRAVQLDQFPTASVESVQVSKTFMPDQQGDAGGGAVNIVTRSIPAETVLSAKFGIAYKQDITGDARFRSNDRPVGYWGKENRRLPVRSPDIPNFPGTTDRFNGTVTDEEALLSQFSKHLSTVVGTKAEAPPYDHSWSVAMGDSYSLTDDLTVGGLASFNYSRKFEGYHNAESLRWRYDQNMTSTKEINAVRRARESQGVEKILWGGLLTAGVTYRDLHELSLTYLYNHAADNHSTSIIEDQPIYYNDTLSEENALFTELIDYIERDFHTFQPHGRHTLLPFEPLELLDGRFTLPSPEIEWVYAKSLSSMEQPDRTRFQARYYKQRGTNYWQHVGTQRHWFEIEETSDQWQLNLKQPFTLNGEKGYLKGGLFDDVVERAYQADFVGIAYPRRLRMPRQPDGSRPYWDDYMNANHPLPHGGYYRDGTVIFPDNGIPIWELINQINTGLVEGIPSDLFGMYLLSGKFATNFDPVDYRGHQEIASRYLMADIPVTPWLRLLGGARLEKTVMTTTVDVKNPENILILYEYDTESGRIVERSSVPEEEAGANLDEKHLLPAYGVVLKPIESLAVRANYSETIARPTFKEITPILSPIHGSDELFIGNKNLRISEMKNYDLRIEWTPAAGSLFAASWFKKAITDVIDRESAVIRDGSQAVIPINYSEGGVQGFEFEARQDLDILSAWLRGLTLGANATVNESFVRYDKKRIANLKDFSGNTDRAMQNQPDLLANAYLTYDIPGWDLDLNLFYSYTGSMLLAGEGYNDTNTGTFYTPSLHQSPADTVSLSLSKTVFGHAVLSVGVKNLLTPDVDRYYEYNGKKFTHTRYETGLEYSASLEFKW
jgi:outer membrane receptor protein involved in Fe transport